MIVERFAHTDVTAAPDSTALSRFYCPEPFGKTQKSKFIARQRSIYFMIVERFAHSHVTAALDSIALSRFHCPEHFGKTQKSSFNAGERPLL